MEGVGRRSREDDGADCVGEQSQTDGGAVPVVSERVVHYSHKDSEEAVNAPLCSTRTSAP